MSDSRSSRLAAFDAWFDRLLEPTRNFKPTIWLFTTATALGDFGILWHIVGIVRAVADTSRVKQALILSALMGVESLLLNQGISLSSSANGQLSKAIRDSRFASLARQVFRVGMRVLPSLLQSFSHDGLHGPQSQRGLFSQSSSPRAELLCAFTTPQIFSLAL